MEAASIRNRSVSLIGVVAAVVMALVLAMALGAGTAKAGGVEKDLNQALKSKTVKTFYFPGSINKDGNSLYFAGTKSVKVVKFNKKFVKVKAVSSTDFEVTVKKAGTSKVVIKYGNKKRTLKIAAYKWTFPFKTLKVGGKDYKAKVKKALYDGWYYYTPINGCNVANKKVVASLSSDWKVKFNNGDTKIGEINTYDSLGIVLQHKKTKWNIEFSLGNWNY